MLLTLMVDIINCASTYIYFCFDTVCIFFYDILPHAGCGVLRRNGRYGELLILVYIVSAVRHVHVLPSLVSVDWC